MPYALCVMQEFVRIYIWQNHILYNFLKNLRQKEKDRKREEESGLKLILKL